MEEKDLEVKLYNTYDDEEDDRITAPYWYVMYVDYDGHKHIATIKDEAYLQYIKNTYTILDCKYIEI